MRTRDPLEQIATNVLFFGSIVPILLGIVGVVTGSVLNVPEVRNFSTTVGILGGLTLFPALVAYLTIINETGRRVS